MNRLKIRQITCLIGIVILTVSVPSHPWASATQGNAERGRTLYQDHCIECHGRTGDGRGAVGEFLEVQPADLLSKQSRMKTDEELFRIIQQGTRFDEMHGWETEFKTQDIWDVLSYIRTLAPRFETPN